MMAYSTILLAGVAVDAALLLAVLLRCRARRLARAYAALSVTFVLATLAHLGTSEGLLPPAWGAVTLWTYSAAHALVPMFVACSVGYRPAALRLVSLGLLAIFPVAVLLAPADSWMLRLGFQANPLGIYLATCLVVAFILSLLVWVKSPLFGREAFWLIAGTFVLLDAGPLFAYELDLTGFRDPGPANLAAPFALAAFALVSFRIRPLPVTFSRHRKRLWISTLPQAGFIAFDEKRPKYVDHVARAEAATGRPVLVLDRGLGAGVPSLGPMARAEIVPTPSSVLRAETTVSEFLAREPRGLVVVKDLASLATLAGWRRTLEFVQRIGSLGGSVRSTVLLSTSCLVNSEKDDLRRLPMTWWVLPDPAEEIDAILAQMLGPSGRTLFDNFLRGQGLTPRTFGLEHIQALAHFVEGAFHEFASAIVNRPGADGLSVEASTIVQALRVVLARRPAELAARSRPRKGTPEPTHDFLVTADEYWRTRDTEPRGGPAFQDDSLYDRVRSVFIEHLGQPGERLLETELAKLGRRRNTFGPWDMSRLSDRAAVDLGVLANAIDFEDGRERLKAHVESLRRGLLALSGAGS